MKFPFFAIFALSLTTFFCYAESDDPDYGKSKTEVVPLYQEADLIKWFATNKHLKRVKQDDCQLVQDIEARARIVGSPAYQFLWGDMLNWGVCVPKDIENGMYYVEQAAKQGLPDAIEHLARYNAKGIIVQKNMVKSMRYFKLAAELGSTKARIEYARYLLRGYGSPRDYEDAYYYLQTTISSNKKTHATINLLKANLALKMPVYAVKRAKARQD